MSLIPLSTRRHSAAHVLAAAVLQMFPEAKLGTGPDTETGFYYDFVLPRPLIPEDLSILEGKMKEIVSQKIPFQYFEEPVERAKEFLEKIHQSFKKELVEKFQEEKNIQVVSFYKNKDIFVDLCEGPHTEHTGQIGAFALTHFSGAYWQGDEKREQMTRIYGLCFANQKDLKKHIALVEEAKKRDHRKLGAELDLFTFSELVGSGLPLFTPKGTVLRNIIADTIQGIQEKYGFEKVSIPHITKKDLYETSGHWQKFKDDLFHVKGKGETEFVMKPMNCPHHTQIFSSKMRSYRDLPLRYAEVTTCYRDELPGELLGLSRVRSLTQDDGHIFCQMKQVKEECRNIVAVIREFYTKLNMFGKNDFRVSLSVRDPKQPEKYLGSTTSWDIAERFLEEVAEEEQLPFRRTEGEAAFYGPKLDFMFKDTLGREWQLATVQVDFVQPERFSLEYVNKHGEKERPVMIHRAIAGAIERFMAIIIEHFSGAFPVWLAPVQAQILPVSDAHQEYATKVQEVLRNAYIRTELISPEQTLGKRIREGQMLKIPFLLVVGNEESKNNTVTVRKYGEKVQKSMKVEEFQEMVRES
jgi:threonyl-tRNA synthetase